MKLRAQPIHLLVPVTAIDPTAPLEAACGERVAPGLRWTATSHAFAATCPDCLAKAQGEGEETTWAGR